MLNQTHKMEGRDDEKIATFLKPRIKILNFISLGYLMG